MRRIHHYGVEHYSERISTIRISNLLTDHAKTRAFYYTDGLTGLRGFAALWVFLYHTWTSSIPRIVSIKVGSYSIDFTPLFSSGWAGVVFLYTLSGFLLTLPFARAAIQDIETPRLSRYFRRRILRIFPAYYAQLGILLCLAWFGVHGTFPSIDNLFLHLFMAHNVSFQYNQAINAIWWTLPVEFSFYLVLPMLAVFLRKSRWPILLVGAIAGTVLYRYGMFHLIAGESVPYKVCALEQFPGHLDQFAFGMLASYFFVRSGGEKLSGHRSRGRLTPTLLVASGLIGIVFCFYLLSLNFQKYWDGHLLLFVWHGCIGFFIALLIYGIAANCPFGRFLFGSRLLVGIGVVSYSFYLWHLPVLEFLVKWEYVAHYKGYVFPFLFIVTLFLSLGFAMISYLVFERPFLISGTRKSE
jgi:peptidoglycan/LPS O-acetylase OafA/YrhL